MNSIMKLLFAKEEATYGSDSSPTSANAIEVFGLSIKPEGERLERNVHANTLSPAPSKTGKRWYNVTFSVELKGSGTKGVAPIIGDLFEACGRTETVSVGSSVTYSPASSTMKSVTLYGFDMLDNSTCRKYVITGAMGEVDFVAEAGKIVRANFSLQGFYSEPTDTTVSFTSYPETTLPPIAESLQFTINGVSTLVIQSLSLALGNKVVLRDDVNAAGSIKGAAITGRAPHGKFNPEAVTKATYNWWNDWTTATSRALSFVVGATAGNIITFTAPKVQIAAPNPGDREGILTDEIEFTCAKNVANDEVVIVFS